MYHTVQAFDRADIDNNGKISQSELYVCMLSVYEQVCPIHPTHQLTQLAQLGVLVCRKLRSALMIILLVYRT